MKNCIIILIALMCSLAARAENASGSCGDNAKWSLDGNTLIISGEGATTDHGSPTSIYATYPEWQQYRDEIHSVIVEEGITSLGSFSFYGYSNLESVSLPEGLVRIGNFAFYSCISLKDITFPSTLEYIGDKLLNYNSNGSVFQGCEQLKTITLPESLKVISGCSFNDCRNLTTVNWNAVDCDADVLDPIVRYVGIFSLSPIESVNFGINVKSIPSKAFLNVSSLLNISTPGTIEFVGWQAFGGTAWEKENTEPFKVLYIDLAAYCFDHYDEGRVDVGMPNYTVEIKAGTKCMTDHLFEDAQYLEKVTIPESIERIGNQAFKNCRALKTVDWNAIDILDDNKEYNADGLFSSSLQVNLEEFNFGCNVQALPSHLLKNCGLIKEVRLPESLVSIEESSFEGCASLVSLIIPDKVERLGRLAISYCENLETLTIGEGLLEFDYYYFLAGCPKLTTLYWNAVHTEEKTFDPLHGTDVCVAPITDFIIGDKVEYVPGQLFWKSSTLANVSFGKSVKIIGEGAFRGCSALTSITLPESLEIIGSYAFCEVLLKGIVIPENVSTLGTWAFGLSPTLSTVIGCPVTAPSGSSWLVDHTQDLRIYVNDVAAYNSVWWGYTDCILPILTADTNELSEENGTTPIFTLNIPEYILTHIDTFVPEKTPGEHVADLKVSGSGPFGNFSTVVPYRYSYTDNNSVGSIMDESEHVEIFNMHGIKVFEGSLSEAESSLSSGIYVVNSAVKTLKIQFE